MNPHHLPVLTKEQKKQNYFNTLRYPKRSNNHGEWHKVCFWTQRSQKRKGFNQPNWAQHRGYPNPANKKIVKAYDDEEDKVPYPNWPDGEPDEEDDGGSGDGDGGRGDDDGGGRGDDDGGGRGDDDGGGRGDDASDFSFNDLAGLFDDELGGKSSSSSSSSSHAQAAQPVNREIQQAQNWVHGNQIYLDLYLKDQKDILDKLERDAAHPDPSISEYFRSEYNRVKNASNTIARAAKAAIANIATWLQHPNAGMAPVLRSIDLPLVRPIALTRQPQEYNPQAVKHPVLLPRTSSQPAQKPQGDNYYTKLSRLGRQTAQKVPSKQVIQLLAQKASENVAGRQTAPQVPSKTKKIPEENVGVRKSGRKTNKPKIYEGVYGTGVGVSHHDLSHFFL